MARQVGQVPQVWREGEGMSKFNKKRELIPRIVIYDKESKESSNAAKYAWRYFADRFGEPLQLARTFYSNNHSGHRGPRYLYEAEYNTGKKQIDSSALKAIRERNSAARRLRIVRRRIKELKDANELATIRAWTEVIIKYGGDRDVICGKIELMSEKLQSLINDLYDYEDRCVARIAEIAESNKEILNYLSFKYTGYEPGLWGAIDSYEADREESSYDYYRTLGGQGYDENAAWEAGRIHAAKTMINIMKNALKRISCE